MVNLGKGGTAAESLHRGWRSIHHMGVPRVEDGVRGGDLHTGRK